MKKKIIGVLLIVLILGSCSEKVSYSEHRELDQKVDSLIAIMTLEEKLGQLNLPVSGDFTTGLQKSTGVVSKIQEGKVGAMFNLGGVEKIRAAQRVAIEESRLGIPLLFGMDVIHGYKTVFPIPLGLSCSWDMDLIERSARIAAQEATADGIHWTFSPMIDISRDPRWGRVAEGAGEDPFLVSEYSKAMVRGYQGSDLSENNTLMACAKHFALYGASEAGRDYNTVDMSRMRMYNEYLPPFHAAVDEGVGTLMASFNEIDGLPATGNKWLLTELLREQWGFEGFVVSDYTGVNEMVKHGVGDTMQTASLGLNAGCDMDMVSEAYLTRIPEALDKGLINMKVIDEACRRILLAKYKLGLFEDPYRYCDTSRSRNEIYTSEHRAEARSIAAQSFVLLKNEGNILPLKKSGKIALIGPMANNARNMPGTWSVAVDSRKAISLRQGIETALEGNGKVLYAKGSNIYTDPDLEALVSVFGKPTYRDDRAEEVMIREAVAVAMQSDVIVAAMGEASESSGECSSMSSIEFPENQRKLLAALKKTGKPMVLVLFNGRPLGLTWENENVPAILDAWFGGSEAGDAIADVLFGDVNPSGKLTMTFPQNTGQIPLHYNHKNTGRPLEEEWFTKFKTNYLDVSNEPLYPFGYGLSYSSFEYGEMKVSDDSPYGDTRIELTVDVTNTSEVEGKEVVQLYIRDMVGSVTRPVSELKGFQKVMIGAGETKNVKFVITTDMLKFYDYDLNYVWESGVFQLMIGPNSRDLNKLEINWSK